MSRLIVSFGGGQIDPVGLCESDEDHISKRIPAGTPIIDEEADLRAESAMEYLRDENR